MPPIDKTNPDPLKKMRQKQAAEAKLLAAQNRQREGIRKEQANMRAAKAAENMPTHNALKTKPTLANTTTKDKLPDPSQTPAVDPEILPEAEQTTNKVTTPEGDVAEVSLDYTLTDEGEGDNIPPH